MGRPLRKGLHCLYRPRLMHSESLCHFYTFLSIFTLHLQNFSWRCSCEHCEHFLRYVSSQLFSLVISQMEPWCLTFCRHRAQCRHPAVRFFRGPSLRRHGAPCDSAGVPGAGGQWQAVGLSLLARLLWRSGRAQRLEDR